MHLAIEAAKLLQEKRGIGRYVRNMLQQFARTRRSMRFTLYVRRDSDAAPLRAMLELLHEGLSARTTFALCQTLADTHADVAWYPWNIITVPSARAPMVVTTHDIAQMLQLDHRWWKVIKRATHKRRFTKSLAWADRVLTISSYSKNEMVSRLHIDPDRIRVTLLAADDLPVREPEAARPLERANISGPFFLTVGGQEGRKNLPTLYKAMHKLYAEGLRVPLVQCGPALSAATRSLRGRAPWLQHVGYVSDAELVTLYRRSVALLYPSRYEGFGLPVLEAMQSGGAVICTNASSLPEVYGDAALTFDWHDVDALCDRIRQMLAEPTLRDELIARGRVQASRFSWAKAAQETLLEFESVASRGAAHAR